MNSIAFQFRTQEEVMQQIVIVAVLIGGVMIFSGVST